MEGGGWRGRGRLWIFLFDFWCWEEGEEWKRSRRNMRRGVGILEGVGVANRVGVIKAIRLKKKGRR